MSCRIGSDIGGTFTDLILASEDGTTFQVGKVLTTPEAPDDAVVAGIEAVLAQAGTPPAAISHVLHGTTLFTNALIERKGARTALVTTRGFRDAIEIAREHRYDMYDLAMQRARPLAPRHLRFELDERVLADGSVRKAVDPAEVRRLAAELHAARVEAVAVCLLHAYANPAPERLVGALLREALPDVAITLSSELVPEIREFERASTTLANVYVQRLAAGYLGRLRDRLPERPFRAHDAARCGSSSRARRPARSPPRTTGPSSATGTSSPSTWAGPRPRSASSSTASPWSARSSRSIAATSSRRAAGSRSRCP